MQNFSYYIPTRLFFGKGELGRIATEKLPGKKALIVTSSGTSMKKYGYLDRLTALLKENKTDYVIFNKILPNPIKSHVMEGAALAKSEGCDFVIGLGGGSSIDASKAIAVMATNEGDYWDYISGGSGTFWEKNKGRSAEGNLKRFTKYAAILFMILAFVLNII